VCKMPYELETRSRYEKRYKNVTPRYLKKIFTYTSESSL